MVTTTIPKNTLYVYRNGKGWRVKFCRQGKWTKKCFADSVLGSPTASYRAAIDYRDKAMKIPLQLSGLPKTPPKPSNSPSKPVQATKNVNPPSLQRRFFTPMVENEKPVTPAVTPTTAIAYCPDCGNNMRTVAVAMRKVPSYCPSCGCNIAAIAEAMTAK